MISFLRNHFTLRDRLRQTELAVAEVRAQLARLEKARSTELHSVRESVNRLSSKVRALADKGVGDTVLADIDMLAQRVDLLQDAFGVEVAADCIRKPPRPVIVSVRPLSLAELAGVKPE